MLVPLILVLGHIVQVLAAVWRLAVCHSEFPPELWVPLDMYDEFLGAIFLLCFGMT